MFLKDLKDKILQLYGKKHYKDSDFMKIHLLTTTNATSKSNSKSNSTTTRTNFDNLYSTAENNGKTVNLYATHNSRQEKYTPNFRTPVNENTPTTTTIQPNKYPQISPANADEKVRLLIPIILFENFIVDEFNPNRVKYKN